MTDRIWMTSEVMSMLDYVTTGELFYEFTPAEVVMELQSLFQAHQLDQPTVNALLSDWVIITSWIDPNNDEHYYFRLNSKGCAPHAREGLAHMLLEMEK